MATLRARAKTTPASTAGSFAGHAHGAPEVVTADPTCIERIAMPERLRIEDYFAGHVAGPEQTPWRRDGIHITLWEGDWAKMPVTSIDPHGLHATQSRVFKKHLARHLGHAGPSAEDEAEASRPGRDRPWVVEYRGQRWVLDGHHRIVRAILADDAQTEVYLLTIAND